MAGDGEDRPSRVLERRQLHRLLKTATARMPSAERTVPGLYGRQELTLPEIAGIVKPRESPVSQPKTPSMLRRRAMDRSGAGANAPPGKANRR